MCDNILKKSQDHQFIPEKESKENERFTLEWNYFPKTFSYSPDYLADMSRAMTLA